MKYTLHITRRVIMVVHDTAKCDRSNVTLRSREGSVVTLTVSNYEVDTIP